jgi:hypothetical protein
VSLGIFFERLPTEPCALRLTQSLKMSTRNSPGGEVGRCVELTTNHPSRAERQEIRGFNLPGPTRAPGGLLREYLPTLEYAIMNIRKNQKYLEMTHQIPDQC